MGKLDEDQVWRIIDREKQALKAEFPWMETQQASRDRPTSSEVRQRAVDMRRFRTKLFSEITTGESSMAPGHVHVQASARRIMPAAARSVDEWTRRFATAAGPLHNPRDHSLDVERVPGQRNARGWMRPTAAARRRNTPQSAQWVGDVLAGRRPLGPATVRKLRVEVRRDLFRVIDQGGLLKPNVAARLGVTRDGQGLDVVLNQGDPVMLLDAYNMHSQVQVKNKITPEKITFSSKLNTGDDADSRLIAHELGHWLQTANPRVSDAEREFLRTTDGKPADWSPRAQPKAADDHRAQLRQR